MARRTRRNIVYRNPTRNLNSMVGIWRHKTVAEVEEIVPTGTLDPGHIHPAGTYLKRLIPARKTKSASKNASSSKRLDVPWNRNAVATRAPHELKHGFYVNLASISNVVEMLVTGLAVFARGGRRGPFRQIELAADVNPGDVRAVTEAHYEER